MKLTHNTADPYTIELPYGIEVEITPLTSASMGLCQSKARKIVQDENIEDEAEKDARYSQELIAQLGIRHIKSWSGVLGEDDKDAELTPDAIKALFDVYPVADRFFQEITVKQLLVNAAKNGLRLSADGISAVEPNTAENASNKISPVQEEMLEPMESNAPTSNTNSSQKKN